MKWIAGIIILFMCIPYLSVYPQTEEITLTTFYPSPYGVYNELEIHDTQHFKDPTGGNAELDLTIDGDANLHLGDNGTSPSGYHIIFDDSGLPMCYLQQYSPGGTTWCADNYVASAVLNPDKSPVNAHQNPLPMSGWIVCIRGWESVP